MKKKQSDGGFLKYLRKTMRIMRLSLFLIVISTAMAFSATSYSQNTKLTLDLNNATVKEVLKTIEDQSEFLFFYQEKHVDLNRQVTLHATEKDVETILNQLFAGTDNIYVINDRQIVIGIAPRKELEKQMIRLNGNLKPVIEQPQQKEITGKVTDSDGLPLPGVSVIVKGTTIGTVTNADGEFLLNIPIDAKVLQVSFVGMITQEISVEGRATFAVVMEEDVVGIEEVVAVGYGTQKKANLTGAVGYVTSEALENRPITSTGEGLQGLIPNLNITFYTGEPGKAPDFNIRGFESINGGNPLILVDGVAMDINLINPNDIESVTILKDASAAAIYGARASFGVILVTTKRGTKRKATFRYNFEYSLSAPIIKVTPISNSYDYALIKNEVSINGGGSPLYSDTRVAGIKAYYEDPVNNPEWGIVNEEFQYYGYTNFRELLLKDAYPSQKHNLSVSGGTENVNYYISAAYLNKDGLYKVGDKDYYKRLNLNMNMDLRATDWLSFNYGIRFNNQKTDDPHIYQGNDAYTINAIIRGYPTTPVKMPYHPDYPQFEGTYFASAYAYFDQGGRWIANTDDLWLNTGTEIEISDQLKVFGDFSYNIYGRQTDDAAPRIPMLDEQIGSSNPITYGQTAADFVSNDIDKNRYYAFNAYGEYERTFNGEHYLKVLVGYNQEYKKYRSNFAKAYQIIDSNNPQLNLTVGNRELDFSLSEWAIRGAFYRVNYIYNDKYLFELSGRYDATSRFPKEDRYSFFPSFSAGWRLSEEGFMEGTKIFFDNLKLRASYGSLGNQLLGNNFYPYIATLGFAQQPWVLTGTERTPTVSPAGLVSPTLTWEKVSTTNFGLDLTILKQRLDFTLDYYVRTTKDMLMQKIYPDILGTEAPQENAADLKTKGWESVLSWRDKIGNDFRYDIRLNLADATTEITKYDNPTGSLDEYYVGQTIGEIWGFETVGIFQNPAEVANSPSQEKIGANWAPGDIHYADLDDDTEVSDGSGTLDDPGDLKILGNTAARYSFGINLNVNYKGWFGGLFFQGVGKQDFWPGNMKYLPFNANAGLFEHMLDYWSEDNKDAYFSRPLNDPKNWRVQTRYLQDAAYIRLKNLTVGYNLPTDWTQRVYINNAKIFFTGQNLWEASKLDDPLVPEEKTGNQEYPFQRVYALGINITF
jgi:TonB-linked SusC/RagA family outer membrane protein